MLCRITAQYLVPPVQNAQQCLDRFERPTSKKGAAPRPRPGAAARITATGATALVLTPIRWFVGKRRRAPPGEVDKLPVTLLVPARLDLRSGELAATREQLEARLGQQPRNGLRR